jgi:hypothetical protein
VVPRGGKLERGRGWDEDGDENEHDDEDQDEHDDVGAAKSSAVGAGRLLFDALFNHLAVEQGAVDPTASAG